MPSNGRLHGTRVLVVGAGPFQVDLIRSAKLLGATVAACDRDPSAPGLAMVDEPFTVDIMDLPAMVRVAQAFQPSGVVTAASDAALPAVVEIGRVLELPALTPEALSRCRDKLETWNALRCAGVPAPVTVEVFNPTEAADRCDDVGGFPVVTKPRSAAGGRGVSIVRDASGLTHAFARAARYRLPDEGVLLQHFVGGLAVGAEVFVRGGRLVSAILMNDQFMPGYVSPVGHSLPCDLSPERSARVIARLEQAAAALGVTDGPVNFDVRFERGDAVVLEANARLGGNSIGELVRRALGIELEVAAILACVGVDPSAELRVQWTQPTASRLLLARGHGRVDLSRLADLPPAAGCSLDLAVRHGAGVAMRVDELGIIGRCLVGGTTATDAATRAAVFAGEVLSRIEVGA